MFSQHRGAMRVPMCFLTIVLLANISAITAYTCTNDSDVLSFSESNGDGQDVFAGQQVTIPCCANAFIGSVEWYRNDSGSFQPFSQKNSSNYVFQHDAQILNIRDVSAQDKGFYRCVASNQTHNVTLDYRLFVHDCNPTTNDIVVLEKPDPEVQAGPGDTPTLPCRGYFGCWVSVSPKAFWSRKDSNGGYSRLEGMNTFFTIRQTTERNGEEVGSNLIFNTVTEDNYTSEYTCWLRDRYQKRLFKVTLTKIPVRLKSGLLALLTLLIILIPICVGSVWLLSGDQISFWVNTKLHRLPHRYDSDKVDTDVTVLCSSTNVDFVKERIVDTLKAFGYTVYFHYEDCQAGKLEVVSLLEGLNKSSHGILYLSKDEEVEKFRDFIMDSAIRLHGGSRVIVVYHGSFSQSLRNFKDELRDRLKIVKRFRLPEEPCKMRVEKNFWCAVRSCLPDVNRPSQDIEFRTGEPLLQSENNEHT